MNMKAIIVGGSGFLGQALANKLRENDFEVVVTSRNKRGNNEKGIKYIQWNKQYAEELHDEIEDNPYILINLAGENIAQKRWTKKRKSILLNSRIETTQILLKTVEQNPPKIFVQGSAIGFYGNSTSQLDENAPVGSGFLASLTQQWEEIAKTHIHKSTRLIMIRTGVVLDKNNGLIQKILPIFKLGLGGKIGSGKQGISWIHLTDWVNAVLFCINNNEIHNIVNLTAPNPISNLEFTKTMGTIMTRPTLIPVPGFLLRLIYGSMANELLLGGQYILPLKLQQSGYNFKYQNITEALKSIV